MKNVLDRRTVGLLGFGVLMMCLVGFCWLFFGRNESRSEVGLINISELSNEFMDNYFDEYAEMTEGGEQENVLIVVSLDSLDDGVAEKVVEGPNHTYYLMYDSTKERDEAYKKFMKNENVSVEKNQKMRIVSYNSWGIETMGIDQGLAVGERQNADVKVAIIDTGLNVGLFRNYFPDKGLSVYDVITDTDSEEGVMDTNGHGTFVAGVVAEGTTSRTSIMAIKANRTEEELYVADVNTAIYKAIDAGADIINMSFGSNEYSSSLKLALDAANAQNIVAVAASGNDNNSSLFYPASYDNTISVAALDQNLERAVWDAEKGLGSTYNATVDYAAPGTMIRGINAMASGTSVAAPHVSMVVALLKSFNRDLGLNEVNTLLRRHVVDLGEEGKDDYYGYGMIDLKNVKFCDGSFCDRYGVFAIEIPMQDLTSGIAEIEVVDDGIIITAEKACMVIISNDGGETYTGIPAVAVDRSGDSYKFEFAANELAEVIVALKGDGDLDGEISTADSNLVNRSLISTNLPSSRVLTAMEKALLDIDGDGEISSSDSNLINRSLISSSLLPYKALMW